ncbi:uncharacterized protein LOC108091372 [Drosophila ficusphila]|uniref:uncharacterized protein LOC108091372 n=1 Tax=Drosophila ficusphila TaxID=30025 RepID=UPI0007E73888|nr:uncharacterized protein LOC108091372 [Drosophila ficusphila]
MGTKKIYWSPARAIIPEIETGEKNIWRKPFTPTYEQEQPQMGLILSWHYGRQWLEERRNHQEKTRKKMKKTAKFIAPDFTSWLEKRKRNKTRQQLIKT